MRGHAVIVGGGVGGLAAGSALLARGWTVEIHERSGGLPETGTALGMWPDALDALQSIGVRAEVEARGHRQAGLRLLRPGGSEIAAIGPRRVVHLIARDALLTALLANLPGGTVRWNSVIESLATAPPADLHVAADGLNSVLRAAVVGADAGRPRRVGSTAFRGTVARLTPGMTETWGDGRLFGITPLPATTTNWFASVRADVLQQHDRGQSAIELLRELYAGWHPAVQDVLAAIAPDGVDRRTLYDLPPFASYVGDAVALLGDAAHAMAPNLGRGACESLIDAVALADALHAAPTLEHGLRRYDRVRRAPTRRTVSLSRRMDRLSTARRLIGVRDVVTRAGARFS